MLDISHSVNKEWAISSFTGIISRLGFKGIAEDYFFQHIPLAGPLGRNNVHTMNINDLLNPTPPSNSGGNTGGNTGGNSGGNIGGNTGGNTGDNSGPSLEELRLTRIRERNHYAYLLEQELNKEIKDRESKGPARFVNRNILCSDLKIKFVVKNPTLPAYDS